MKAKKQYIYIVVFKSSLIDLITSTVLVKCQFLKYKIYEKISYLSCRSRSGCECIG